MVAAKRVSALDRLDETERKRLESDAAAITKEFQNTLYVFKLKAPGSLTVKIGDRYTKQPYIGDEQFEGDSAYVGKSGKVIVVFKEREKHTTLMEMPLNECLTKLEGFPAFINTVSASRDDDDVAEIRAEADEIEEVAHVEARRDHFAENPAFGSW